MNKITVTLVLIVSGSLAAGIALARPDSNPPATGAAPGATAVAAPADDAYGQPAATTPAAPGAAPAPAPAEPALIEIRDFAFGGQLALTPGQALVVTNADTAPHTLTFDAGGLDTGVIDGGGSVAVTAPAAPGSYSFFCTIHPSMTGELVVQG